MPDKPKRFRDRDELTMDQELAVQQAARRGESAPKFETDEYRAARREALADAGLEPEDGAESADKPLEEMSVGDHVERLQRDRSRS
jgi:hypothetical protein